MRDSRDDADIEASRAPLVEHLTELRNRLIKALIGLAIATIVCFFFAADIFNILLWPYEQAAGNVRDIHLIYTAPQEFLFTQFKLALFGGFFISFPIIAGQLYMFVAPGLYRNERKAFLPFLVATPVLFILGGALVYFLVMPLAMQFFLGMEQTGENVAQIQLVARVSEYLSLIMTLIFAFGICFQMPVVLTLLARAGIIGSNMLKSKRKHAIVLVFLVAAFLTPPDPISQIGLAIPTLLLYEISILAVRRVEKRRDALEREKEAESA
ncbi:MAG: twin-arginine translocase subunit TatC [Flavobacteriaceae bacterium]